MPKTVAKANEWGELGTEGKKESLSLFYTPTLARLNAFLNDRIEQENLELQLPPARERPDDRIAVASRWGEYDSVIQLTKQLYKFSKLPNMPHGLYRKLFETLRIWQQEGLLYLPMLSYTKYQFGKQHQGVPGVDELMELLTNLIRLDEMRKLHVPLHWVEYLNRQGGGES